MNQIYKEIYAFTVQKLGTHAGSLNRNLITHSYI